MFEKVANLLAEKVECEVSEIKMDTKFSDLGIDSLDVTELLMDVEDEFSVEIEMDASIVTVADLIAKIQEKQNN